MVVTMVTMVTTIVVVTMAVAVAKVRTTAMMEMGAVMLVLTDVPAVMEPTPPGM
jgi:ABC-type maltose transport system permease subunit